MQRQLTYVQLAFNTIQRHIVTCILEAMKYLHGPATRCLPAPAIACLHFAATYAYLMTLNDVKCMLHVRGMYVECALHVF